MAESEHDTTADAMQGYYDWQVTTLMLAHDLNDPINAGDTEQSETRRRALEDEVRQITLAVVPDLYKQDPSLDWPPELMMAITKTTLEHAARIVGLLT